MRRAEAALRPIEELQVALVLGVDREDLALHDVGEDVVVLQFGRQLVAGDHAVGAGDRLHLESGIAGGVAEGPVGGRDLDLAAFDGIVEVVGLRKVAVLGRLDQDAVVAALVERPAEVGAGSAGVDLFLPGPAGVGDEEVAVLVETHGEGIAQAELEHLRLVGIQIHARLDEGIVGQAVAGLRVDAQDLARQAFETLDGEGARIGEVEGGAVADRNVKRAVRAERDRAAGMRGGVDLDVVLHVRPGVGVDVGGRGVPVARAVDRAIAADIGKRLAGAADQDDLAVLDDGLIARAFVGGEAHQIGKTVARAVRAVGAGLVLRFRRIDHVEGVDVRLLREVRVQLDVEQAAVAPAVHLFADIDEVVLELVVFQVVDLDAAALLGDQNLRGIVRQELEGDRPLHVRGERHFGDVEVGAEGRVRRVGDRVLVVQDVDLGGARKQQAAAVDIDDRDREALRRLGPIVVEQRNLDQDAVFAGFQGHEAAGIDVVVARSRRARRHAVLDLHGTA